MSRIPRLIGTATATAVGLTLAMLAASDGSPAQVQPDLIPSIPLRNNSSSALYFFLAENGTWKKLALNSGAEADLPMKSVIIAVPTTDDTVAETSAPQRQPSFAPDTDVLYQKPYYFRRLTSGQRWELCWSRDQGCWLVQKVGEALCR